VVSAASKRPAAIVSAKRPLALQSMANSPVASHPGKEIARRHVVYASESGKDSGCLGAKAGRIA
jgi:hypothetical protein